MRRDSGVISKTNVPPQTGNTEQTKLDISVVVPFYNAERHIEDCINALLAQRYASTRYEIIMVNNNSTDSSAALVRKYPGIKLLTTMQRQGYSLLQTLWLLTLLWMGRICYLFGRLSVKWTTMMR